ncbi:MAG TPA: hypothetical protein VMK16_04915 [Acidimicrobiales bacterium]|nr:hypothetical protein [Acidimicrobiales bacterium]
MLAFGWTWEAPDVKEKPTVPDWIMMAGGLVCLLFSFFAFYKFGSSSRSAWGSGLFPIATYVALFGLIVGGSAALRVFAGTKLPEPLVGFTWKEIRFALSIFAGLLMLGYLIVDKGGLDFGIGFWFMLLGAIALVVGAVMETIGFNPQPAAGGGGAAPGASPPAPPPPPSSPPPPPPSA